MVMSGIYVALGDSMSIDDYAGGPGRGAASLLYRNRALDFPEWSGRDLAGRGYTAQILARDGARADDVLTDQLARIDEPPSVVTLTVGGNDLLTVYGDTEAASTAVERVAAITARILDQLRTLGGDDCRIVLTTVYDPSDGTGAATSELPPWPDGPRVLGGLNAALAGLVHDHGAVLADVHRHFIGHGVNTGDPAQTQARPANRDLWYCGVVEPNAWGAHQIRRTWWQALDPVLCS